MPNSMQWSSEKTTRLRQLWSAGVTSAEIARRLDVSKNAIVGKAHRLNLAGRPSPIKRRGADAPGLPVRPHAPRLTDVLELASAASPQLLIATGARSTPQARSATRPRLDTLPTRLPTVRHTAAATGNKSCCWPIGEPGTRSFRFCDNPALVSKPYCRQHAAIAYQPKQQRIAGDGPVR